jgi:hypothetical protein
MLLMVLISYAIGPLLRMREKRAYRYSVLMGEYAAAFAYPFTPKFMKFVQCTILKEPNAMNDCCLHFEQQDLCFPRFF